jgi:nucleotide-binding universal stress UspA family protein
MQVELDKGEAAFPGVPLAGIALKRILVPVDFSESSRKALQYAGSFARQFNAELILLHVVEPPAYPGNAPLVVTAMMFDDADLRELAAKKLSELRNEIGSQTAVKANVRSGVPYHEIIRAAEETNTDLIVISTHSRTGFARMFLGSTAERVVRHAPCPVMVIRQKEHDFVQTNDSVATKSRRHRTKSR